MPDTLLIGPDPTPVYLEGRPHPALLLSNPGTTTLYLDDQPRADADKATPLNPGANTVWAADQALYVFCPTAGTLQTSPNAAAIFDPSVIAGQLIAQGLAGDIADAINLKGVPAIERLTSLLDSTATFTDGVAPPDTAVIDVSNHPSLILTMDQLDVVGTYFGKAERFVTVRWLPDSNPLGVSMSSQTFLVAAAYGRAELVLPTRAPYVQIIYSTISIGVDTYFTTKLWGSYRTAPRTRGYWTNGVIPAASLTPVKTSESLIIYSQTTPATTTQSGFPPVYGPGRVTVQWRITAMSVASELLFLTFAAVRMGQILIPVSTGVQEGSFEFYTDCEFEIRWAYAGAAANSCSFAIGYDAAN